ncbi:amino acid ABC transporter substrate-binding protein [Prosthecomicrobium sp. N25]|uniref:amino acid ABC transporter substrate-binding protein n=1 Tax=Prosthecomicrobium sp. N25 TaxID=3129254 RepID=UPI0030787A8A
MPAIAYPVAVIAALIGGFGEVRGDELSGTLKRINERGTITIGHRDASVPFSFYDEGKRPVGYAIDLCNAVAERIRSALKRPDLQVAYVLVTPQNRLSMVAEGKVDMECGSTTNTLARQEQVDFSAITFTTGTRLLVRKAAGAREIEDLQGKSIGVVGGSTNEKAVKAMIDAGTLKDLRLVAFPGYAEAGAALEGGRVDAVATDDVILFGLLSRSPAKGELAVVGRLLTYDPYGIMLPRNDSSFRLVVNRTLADLSRSGEIRRLHARWFDPVGVPLSPLLDAAFTLQALPE